MPQRAWSAKRERQYEHIEQGLEERGRSKKVAKEIAARTVNKERARTGEAKQASRTSTEDISSSRRGGLRSHSGPGGRTREQLYAEARVKNVKGRSTMSRAQLAKAVGGWPRPALCPGGARQTPLQTCATGTKGAAQLWTPPSSSTEWPPRPNAGRVSPSIEGCDHCQPMPASSVARSPINRRSLPVGRARLSGTTRPCVTVAPKHTGDVEDAHLHRARMPRTHLDATGGLRLTSVARTAVDIGREHGVAAGLVVADAALHRRLTAPSVLRRCVYDCRGWTGVRAARAAIAFADGRCESPLESVSRLRLFEGGIPQPDLQLNLFDDAGRFLGRAAFYWDEFGVVGEADGALKYDDAAAIYAEKLRQDALEAAGLIVLRWGWRDLANCAALIGRVERAFYRGKRHDRDRGWVVHHVASPR